MHSGKSSDAEAASTRVPAIPGLKNETWGTRGLWEREMRIEFLIAWGGTRPHEEKVYTGRSRIVGRGSWVVVGSRWI
jgi:hypothetical protein